MSLEQQATPRKRCWFFSLTFCSR